MKQDKENIICWIKVYEKGRYNLYIGFYKERKAIKGKYFVSRTDGPQREQ